MRRAGIETWLMHVLRGMDRARWQFDFAVSTAERCAYDDEIESYGGRILRCPTPRNPARYAAEFYRLLRERGPFDVVHSHLWFHSAMVLSIARAAGVPRRIAHGHTAIGAAPQARWRGAYEHASRALLHRVATAGLANSAVAARGLFGERWREDRRWRVLLYGFDFAGFSGPHDPAAVRRELGIPEGRLVIGHVGRLMPVKNHGLLVRAFRAAVRAGHDVHLVLVGDGPLMGEVRGELESHGELLGRYSLLGDRGDVARYEAAFDVMALPSRAEGFGIVVVESQAAGVPVLVSDAVPPEVDVVPSMVRRLPLSAGPEAWGEALVSLARAERVPRAQAYERVRSSELGIEQCLARLGSVYEPGHRAARGSEAAVVHG